MGFLEKLRRFSDGDEAPPRTFWRALVAAARAMDVDVLSPLERTITQSEIVVRLLGAPEFTGLVTSASGGGYTVQEARFSTATGRWAPMAGGRVVRATEYNLDPSVAIKTAVDVRYTSAGDWRFYLARSGSTTPGGGATGCPWTGSTSLAATLKIHAPSDPANNGCLLTGPWSDPLGCRYDTEVTACFYDTTYNLTLQNASPPGTLIVPNFAAWHGATLWSVAQVVGGITGTSYASTSPWCTSVTITSTGRCLLVAYLICSGSDTKMGYFLEWQLPLPNGSWLPTVGYYGEGKIPAVAGGYAGSWSGPTGIGRGGDSATLVDGTVTFP